MWEVLKLPLMMVGGGMLAILLLMLVAKMTSMVDVEAREGKKPVYSMEAEVKGKRMLVEPDPENQDAMRTLYFVTFHKRDGNRVEFRVPGEDYGLAAEGDEGILVWQGDEFMVFKRTS